MEIYAKVKMLDYSRERGKYGRVLAGVNWFPNDMDIIIVIYGKSTNSLTILEKDTFNVFIQFKTLYPYY